MEKSMNQQIPIEERMISNYLGIALQFGKKVARKKWDGTGMYLKLIQSHPVNGHLQSLYNNDEFKDPVLMGEKIPFMEEKIPFHVPPTTPDGSPNITQGLPGQMLSHIVIKTEGSSKYWGEGFSDYVAWIPSYEDILADDWIVIE